MPYKLGEDPEKDAWYTAFFIENHLDHLAYPDKVSSPEKVRFMVYTVDDERYYPCSDRMFESIVNRTRSVFLQEKYNEVLQRVIEMVSRLVEAEPEREYLKALIHIKYKHETRDEIMIPSRLEKRLINIFHHRTQIEDPFLFEKEIRNQRMQLIMSMEPFKNAIESVGPEFLPEPPTTVRCLNALSARLKIMRLLSLTGEKKLWETDAGANYQTQDFEKILDRRFAGTGEEPFLDFLGISEKACSQEYKQPKKILWLIDEAGEVQLDMAVINHIAGLGHQIVVALKEGHLYTKVAVPDAHTDPGLQDDFSGLTWIRDPHLGKNALLDILRSDQHILLLSDGTQENLNLLLTTTTFARVFKEVDAVVSRGQDQKRRLFYSHFQFTRDVFSIATEENGTVTIDFKPCHPDAVKFSHRDLEKRAETIISEMQQAKSKGMTVMFYSGIIGSIPGKIRMAKKIMSKTVTDIRNQATMTLVINPSEYFEQGMDADDLMYMWEIVQRSGLIDIWRFQTYEDIARAFHRMNMKVPPEWVGKDATFSTGCTKEMKIAIDVQRRYPEMQIIGPSKERFTRREEYGVGKMYDHRLEVRDRCQLIPD